MKPDSTGVPLKGVEIHAFDTESGDQLPIDVIGEICMNSDNMFVEYINNPTETRMIKQKHNDGKEWIHTGDLGYIDSDGFIFITGRTKRLIKMDGFKIAPETIETVVLEMEEIKDCVVVGVPDEKHVEVPMLFCEKQEGSNLTNENITEIVMKRCHEVLPDYEHPKYIEVVEGIPHKNGKHDFISLSARGKEYVESLS
jgi:long-chain acyl-CoA synthetase